MILFKTEMGNGEIMKVLFHLISKHSSRLKQTKIKLLLKMLNWNIWVLPTLPLTYFFDSFWLKQSANPTWICKKLEQFSNCNFSYQIIIHLRNAYDSGFVKKGQTGNNKFMFICDKNLSLGFLAAVVSMFSGPSLQFCLYWLLLDERKREE